MELDWWWGPIMQGIVGRGVGFGFCSVSLASKSIHFIQSIYYLLSLCISHFCVLFQISWPHTSPETLAMKGRKTFFPLPSQVHQLGPPIKLIKDQFSKTEKIRFSYIYTWGWRVHKEVKAQGGGQMIEVYISFRLDKGKGGLGFQVEEADYGMARGRLSHKEGLSCYADKSFSGDHSCLWVQLSPR